MLPIFSIFSPRGLGHNETLNIYDKYSNGGRSDRLGAHSERATPFPWPLVSLAAVIPTGCHLLRRRVHWQHASHGLHLTQL